MMTEKTKTGSQIVSMLETAWKAIQRNHPDLPDVVMITGTGAAGGEWGHTWHDHWMEGRAPGADPIEHNERDDDGGGELSVNPATHKTELFIAGERLYCGGKLTFQTMLHEAAHVLARVRSIQDTSRQGRYHNKQFVALATEVGLAWPESNKPDTVIGFSAVEITEATTKRYRKVITGLDNAIQLYLDLPLAWKLALGMGGSTTGTAGTTGVAPRLPRRTGRPNRTGRASRNNPMAQCGCEEPRKIRVAPKTLEVAPIVCGACGEEFTIPDA